MTQTAAKPDIASLRRRIEALAVGRPQGASPRLALGPAPIDAALGGGLDPHALHEAAGAGARAFAAGLAGRLEGPVVWVAHDRQEAQLYPSGMKEAGLNPENIIFVSVPAAEVAWAFEQALRSGAAATAVAEAARLPDFTQSRRLQLAAREGRALALLLAMDRRARRLPASAADTRWRVTPRPAAGPGAPPRYRLDLQKNKKGSTRIWEVEWHAPSHRFHLAAAL